MNVANRLWISGTLKIKNLEGFLIVTSFLNALLVVDVNLKNYLQIQKKVISIVLSSTNLVFLLLGRTKGNYLIY